jgi:hypothetical protein
MKKFKKLVASLLAVSSMALCMSGISASAYTNSVNYSIYYNKNGVSKTSQTLTVKASSDGNYGAYISGITSGCSVDFDNGKITLSSGSGSFYHTSSGTYTSIEVQLVYGSKSSAYANGSVKS